MSCGSGLPVDHPAGQKERDERMWTALVDVGPSVLSGITFTKLIGMCVLALTRSKLLEVSIFGCVLGLVEVVLTRRIDLLLQDVVDADRVGCFAWVGASSCGVEYRRRSRVPYARGG